MQLQRSMLQTGLITEAGLRMRCSLVFVKKRRISRSTQLKNNKRTCVTSLLGTDACPIRYFRLVLEEKEVFLRRYNPNAALPLVLFGSHV